MTKTLMGAAMAACLVGCAQTPMNLRESGTRFDYGSSQPPDRVASCILQNAENRNTQARIRTTDTGTLEVLAFGNQDGALNAMLVAELAAAPGGTRGIVFVSRNVMAPDRLRDALTAGC